jgi:hypothetical protein
MTHADLVILAARWVAANHRCCVVLTEWRGGSGHEIPDVIGWRGEGWSVLVECKTSRADFRADAQKSAREWAGMGQERWFFAPYGIIPPKEVPEGWGLAEFGSRVHTRVTPADSHLFKFDERTDTVSLEDRGARSQLEVRALVSALRRLSEVRGIPALAQSMRDGARDTALLDRLCSFSKRA